MLRKFFCAAFLAGFAGFALANEPPTAKGPFGNTGSEEKK